MANNVYSRITFREINEDAVNKLKELFDRCEEQEWGRRWFADMFVEGDVTYDNVKQYEWTCEHIGPKWCYIEDHSFESDDVFLQTESAWSPPEQGMIKLLEILTEIDPNIVTTLTYEDEMPNFIGAYVYKGTEIVDGAEDDSNEIVEYVLDGNPELREHWDEDTDDWVTDEDGNYTEASEEASDTYQEVLYEWISIRQDEIITETLEYIEEEE